jgi:hypothetical protein
MLILAIGCSSEPDADLGSKTEAGGSAAAASAEIAELSPDHVLGIYSSPSEVGGFTGTVLVLERGVGGDLRYEMTFYSDVVSPDDIEQEIQTGGVLIEGDHVYIPRAHGYYHDGVPRLLASIDRYTIVTINGHQTLMRDDAYKVYQQENRLFDYGILIRVSDPPPLFWSDFASVEHKSIKVLYEDPTKEWQDPYVHGPNER